MSDTVVGIDLGTTFSVIAYLDEQGRPVTIPNAEGDLTTPSVVFLDRAGAIVGKEAIKAAEFEPDRIARFPKRDMGRDTYRHPVRGEAFPPEAFQAIILRKLKQDAEARLGPLQKAVITVPAYFNEPRRKATQDAGRMAGWDVIDIINEPTAAAIAFGRQRGFVQADPTFHSPETILVYDLGGGTFDVTLMRIEENCCTVLATAGDVELGGIDWDDRIIAFVAAEVVNASGTDPRRDPGAAQRLRLDAEDAKRTLSARSETVIPVAAHGQRYRIPLTRAKFEELTSDLLERTVMTTQRLLRDASKSYGDLTRLLVVGGATRMPMVTSILEVESGRAVDRSLSPDEAVAHGAALYGAALAGDPRAAKLRIQNVCAHDLGVLGVEAATGMKRRHIMIGRNSPLPASRRQRFPTFRDNQRAVSVRIIEGGDAAGNSATAIGKCVVRDLPSNLPKGTPIEVSFTYLENGRLEVTATMPTIDKRTDLIIERATGMPEENIAAWIQAIQVGLADGAPHPPPGQATPNKNKILMAKPVAPPPGRSDENPFQFG